MLKYTTVPSESKILSGVEGVEGHYMANVCARCGKGNSRGNIVTFSGKKVKRMFKPNLHVFWVSENSRRVRKKFCTKCLRIMKKRSREDIPPQIAAS